MTTFTPQLGDLYTMIAVCAVAFAALVFLAFRVSKNKHPDPRRRVLLPMLCYFIALLALMGAMGGFWSVFKYPVVEVSDTALVLNGKEFARPKSRDLRLESYTGSGLNATTRVLMVHTSDRRTWAFPEDRYPINEMMRVLK